MSLLLEALKKAEKSKQENAARQGARISPVERAPEPAGETPLEPEAQESFDLNELTLAPPRESAPPEEEAGETAFPEISLPEAAHTETAGVDASPEIPAWTHQAPEAPAPAQDNEAVAPPPEIPAIALALDFPENPAGKTEPLLTLDFPQAAALPEAPPPPEPAAVAPEPAPVERVAPQPPPAAAPMPPPEPVAAPVIHPQAGGDSAPMPPPEPVAAPPAPPVRPAAGGTGAEAAKKILAASRGKPVGNPKLLGGILLVSMLAGAAGYYYYQQMLAQPGIAFHAPPPAAHAPQAPAAEAPPADAPAAPPAAISPAGTPPAPEQPARVAEKTVPPPDVPVRTPKKAATASAPPPSAGAVSGSIATATVSPAPPAASPPAKQAAAADNGIKIRRDSGETRLDPLLAGAWQAYMAGDIARAENDYRRVLKQQPNSRDALLGLAAIATGRGQPSEAAALYQQILQLDPRDAAAQAGLIGLRGHSDPNASESRLKILIGQSPDAGYLHFALGNLYAQQSRWPEAQEAYFNALHSDANNADYAFNLAVSLDHLDQHRLALEYYRRALDLAAQGKVAAFDRARAKNRIQELLPPQG